jgi:ABC-2 type transport system ATP-binding protein
MLTISNISKSYRKKEVLHNVSFSIGPNTLNEIVGENGAGKSTLLKVIVGELKASHGSVRVNGKTGYCPQESLVFPMLTVEENFYYFASAYGLVNIPGENNWLGRRDWLMSQFKYTNYLYQRAGTLSGGTQQKLNLSISLLHDPDILILDEPYSGFDWETYQHFWEIILDFKTSGKSILLVTHLLNALQSFDSVFFLKQGKLI